MVKGISSSELIEQATKEDFSSVRVGDDIITSTKDKNSLRVQEMMTGDALTEPVLNFVEAFGVEGHQAYNKGHRINFREQSPINAGRIVTAAFNDDEGTLTFIRANSEAIVVDGFLTSKGLGVGPTGPRGLRGANGYGGSDGLDGVDGDIGCSGDVGPEGPEGEAGEAGNVGVQGMEGPGGCEGATGDKGPPGPPGRNGFDGPRGRKGSNCYSLPGPDGIKGLSFGGALETNKLVDFFKDEDGLNIGVAACHILDDDGPAIEPPLGWWVQSGQHPRPKQEYIEIPVPVPVPVPVPTPVPPNTTLPPPPSPPPPPPPPALNYMPSDYNCLAPGSGGEWYFIVGDPGLADRYEANSTDKQMVVRVPGPTFTYRVALSGLKGRCLVDFSPLTEVNGEAPVRGGCRVVIKLRGKIVYDRSMTPGSDRPLPNSNFYYAGPVNVNGKIDNVATVEVTNIQGNFIPMAINCPNGKPPVPGYDDDSYAK